MDSAGLGELVVLYTTVGATGILTHFDTSAAAAAWLAQPG